MKEVLIALFSILGTGLGATIYNSYRLPKTSEMSELALYRKELKDDIGILRTDLKTANNEIDAWKVKYYKLLDEDIEKEGKLYKALEDLAVMTTKYKVLEDKVLAEQEAKK